jgi:hypothetical protein
MNSGVCRGKSNAYVLVLKNINIHTYFSLYVDRNNKLVINFVESHELYSRILFYEQNDATGYNISEIFI